MSDVTTAPAVPFQAAFRTDPGRVRTNNEDIPLVDAERGVYGVIDGVGGHAAGEVAAAIAADVILQRLSRPLGTAGERVREAIALANNEIYRRAEESPDLHGMTCVVTLALLNDSVLTIGHVGDTRLYKLRPAGIRKLTRDHSPVGEREDAAEISEAEAMRHPRRNEVFRDVGGAYRDKDEDEYVDVIEEPMERDSALVLCSDGLTDMVPSTTIERIVRRLAGAPQAVVDALIDAANDAGGRDNVTVVYVEGPEFAAACRRRPVEPPVLPREGGALSRAARAVVRSRTTWFALGAIAGVLGALGLIWWMPPTTAAPSGRTWTAGPVAVGQAAPRVADVLPHARPGDTIRLEPGIYRERVLLPGGVSLAARIPGSVTFARGAGVSGEWVAVTAIGDAGGRISGIRFEGAGEMPIDVAIRVSGQGRVLDVLEFAGPVRTAVDLLPGAGLSVYGCQFGVHGTALNVRDRAIVAASGNTFVRNGRGGTALVRGEGSQLTVRRNVFAGFGADLLKGASAAERQDLAAGNLVLGAAGGDR